MRQLFSKLAYLVMHATARSLGLINGDDSASSKSFYRLVRHLNRTSTGPTKFFIFDIGANKSLWLENLLRLDSRGFIKEVVAIEPVEETFQTLENRFQEERKVSCLQLAIGERDEAIRFAVNSNNSRISHALH